jgi:F0F1-type ATP synthase membrane subunit c/vacuolar-type H+-ATPase subunit K
VTAAILVAHGTVSGDGIAVGLAGYACALLCRNRMASWCLARQAP